MNAISNVPAPYNEPARSYAAGSVELDALLMEAKRQTLETVDLPAYIGGSWIEGQGPAFDVRAPHAHDRLVGVSRETSTAQAQHAVEVASAAAQDWRHLGFEDRAAVFLRAADLLAGKYRNVLNGATMVGQSKTVAQAEIDSACELADFWRFNVSFARDVLAEQPSLNSPQTWNRLEHRALEGFVYAITPFNFTAIAGNLPTAPALMGNVVLWKPSPTQQLAAHYTMKILEEAGLPPGVINMLPGDGRSVSRAALADRRLAGVHFTGSTSTLHHLWGEVATNIGQFDTYPRIVGETGGKGFVLAHASADPAALTTALVRGAFEYQGQKCSAASRAYIPRSLWSQIKDDLATITDGLAVGDVTDPTNFMSAVIDQRSYSRVSRAIAAAKDDPTCSIVAGGTYDDSAGWYVRPTVVEVTDPDDALLNVEYFGPLLAVHPYADDAFDDIARWISTSSRYALTGAVFANDRGAVNRASRLLEDAAGNFYINDKPTGAVVGQQPFGGARASGTNDKAGSPENLRRWTSTRTIKENLAPPTDYAYPHMGSAT